MTREEVFESWAPPEAYSVWTTWVKPVLFSQLPAAWAQQEHALAREERHWPERLGHAAIIVDLPGAESVQAGLSLAQRGFRPVPLFNGVPDQPARPLQADPLEYQRVDVAIDVWPIMRLLWQSAAYLQGLHLPAAAPPAFLLDTHRRQGQRSPVAGVLDNRWMTFPTDFPSARMLLEHDITDAVVITETAESPAGDLAHTLLRWQEAGVKIHVLPYGLGGPVQSIVVQRPGMFGAVWYQFLRMLGLRRSLLGGFGGRVPEASSG